MRFFFLVSLGFNIVILTVPHDLYHRSGKDEPPKLSLPKGLGENVDHSALLNLGSSVSERVNRFDSKRGGEGGGLSKLQETRRIFEQRTLQVSSSSSSVWGFGFWSWTDASVVFRRNKLPPTASC